MRWRLAKEKVGNVDQIFAAVHRIPFELKADPWWIVCHSISCNHMPEIHICVELDEGTFPFTNEESHWTPMHFFAGAGVKV